MRLFVDGVPQPNYYMERRYLRWRWPVEAVIDDCTDYLFPA